MPDLFDSAPAPTPLQPHGSGKGGSRDRQPAADGGRGAHRPLADRLLALGSAGTDGASTESLKPERTTTERTRTDSTQESP